MAITVNRSNVNETDQTLPKPLLSSQLAIGKIDIDNKIAINKGTRMSCKTINQYTKIVMEMRAKANLPMKGSLKFVIK
jgi:hypothetical protein